MIRIILIALVGAFLLASGVSAQQPGRHQRDSTGAMQGPGVNRQMVKQKIQESDARLDRLVSQMNQSTGNKKVQAMAAVINELVAQRKQMHQRMGQMMDSGMMGGPGRRPGMMQNMQPSGSDTSSVRSPANDSGNHAEHHDTLK